MLKVAIVGCGKIADAHATQIQKIEGCEIVGVCDREPLMARQLYDRFPVKHYFGDLQELISATQPDVVHITTPPATHFEMARLCLERGCHVYVEKPFTVWAAEAEQLVSLAQSNGLKLTVGHNDQFSPVARRLRALVATGYVGVPLHMESHYSYDLGDPSYARALLGNRDHWVRQLPGQLLQNVISHGIARIAEFLDAEDPTVIAHGFVSTFLRNIGESEIIDELRVIITDEKKLTAYFTFSSQIRPSIHEFRIYGSKNGLILDNDHDILIKLKGRKYKSYIDKFIPPIVFAKQHLSNFKTNVGLFLGRDFHMDSGMKYLIESFYRSIREGSNLPISYREILLTSRIMDSIFQQLNAGPSVGKLTFQSQEAPPTVAR
jgi:predicted dehydrogenase